MYFLSRCFIKKKKGEPLFDKLCMQSYMYRTMVLEVSVVTSKIIQNAQFVSGLTYYSFFFFFLPQTIMNFFVKYSIIDFNIRLV